MKSILIPTMFGDTDSIYVMTALEESGAHVVRWVGDDFTQGHTSSFSISPGLPPTTKMRHAQGTKSLMSDVVWLRRPRWPAVSSEIDPRDLAIANQESRAYVRSVFEAMSDNAIWVNSLAARRRANSKPLQLSIAQNVGLVIPETLISNDPADITSFLSKHAGETIVKPMLGGNWTEEGKVHCSYTARISLDELPSAIVLKACPAIYQRMVAKKYEVRATFFGRHVIAVRLESQDNLKSRLDWRIEDIRNLKASQVQLPQEVYEKCLALMTELGVIHGSFDFAIDEDDKWIFFEINEAGQFLWLETYVPGVKVLDIFTKFLLEPSVDFRYKPGGPVITMENVSRTRRFIDLVRDDRMAGLQYKIAEAIL